MTWKRKTTALVFAAMSVLGVACNGDNGVTDDGFFDDDPVEQTPFDDTTTPTP